MQEVQGLWVYSKYRRSYLVKSIFFASIFCAGTECLLAGDLMSVARVGQAEGPVAILPMMGVSMVAGIVTPDHRRTMTIPTTIGVILATVPGPFGPGSQRPSGPQ